jgi:molybdopterin molybdotransferase
VIVTGGVSVGKYDMVPAALDKLGARVRFHGVDMKPGRPQLYATLSRGRAGGPAVHPRRDVPLFGLPGNPVSVMTGFRVLVVPALRRMAGVRNVPPGPPGRCRVSLRLPLRAAVRSKGDRTWFAPARLVSGDAGTSVELVSTRGSADLIAAARADGLAVVPKGAREMEAGTVVDFLPWRALP